MAIHYQGIAPRATTLLSIFLKPTSYFYHVRGKSKMWVYDTFRDRV
ncbi:MAG: hypothetical protein Q7R88_01735 [bacterium]|nr:hypothetical protein [bacterium]